eukprot:6181206-Pleurochrysis_carterae.AAC.7
MLRPRKTDCHASAINLTPYSPRQPIAQTDAASGQSQRGVATGNWAVASKGAVARASDLRPGWRPTSWRESERARAAPPSGAAARRIRRSA